MNWIEAWIPAGDRPFWPGMKPAGYWDRLIRYGGRMPQACSESKRVIRPRTEPTMGHGWKPVRQLHRQSGSPVWAGTALLEVRRSGADVDHLNAPVAGFGCLRRGRDQRMVLAHPDRFQARRGHAVLGRQIGHDSFRPLL